MTFDVVKLPLMKQDLRSLFAVDLKILAGFYFLEFQCLYNWIFLSQLMTYGIFICEQQTGAWKLWTKHFTFMLKDFSARKQIPYFKI